jgi:uncharacterized protein with PQ loop repeat
VIQNPSSAPRAADASPLLRRAVNAMSVFTLAMTVPQVWTIWVSRQAAGVSALSWGAYLLSACLWLVYGLRQGDRNIYLPCIGWIVLDAAVLAGALLVG